ncbi:MAG: MbcA/ParS/Xre antitoxin family protein, partial [Candidatus Binatia bacterium]
RAAAVGAPFIVMWAPDRAATRRVEDATLLRLFSMPERVQIARTQEAFDAFLTSVIATVEVVAERSTEAAGAAPEVPRPSPLDKVRAFVAATKDLRGPRGRLSAEPIAQLYGVSVSHVAAWMGRSRQAVTKAPEADSVQQQLAFFERIARLRAVMNEPADFRRWLRMPNEDLQGKSPLDLLDAREPQVVADLVDDMLTGSPG